MPQTDYILREIEKIGAMLRRLIRRRIEQKETQEEEQSIEQIIDEFFHETGIEMSEILNLDIKDFTTKFDLTKGFNLENIVLLADYLSTITHSIDVTNQKKYKIKALEMYNYINETSRTFSSEREKKIAHLKKQKLF